jgi:hypothetical protein
MEKVLLAIDGITPSKKALDYAIELCNRIKADLNILQLIDIRVYHNRLKKMRTAFNSTKNYFEDSMMAITFAEAGESGTALKLLSEASAKTMNILPKQQKENVEYQIKVTHRDNEEEIIDYVDEHKNVVLAIYNHGLEFQNDAESRSENTEKRHRKMNKKIQRKLSVPLVIINY